MSDYEPGTFAMVTIEDNEYPAVRGRRPFNKWYTNGPILGSQSSFSDAQVSNVRPLATLDIPVAELRCVAENLRARANHMWGIEAPNTAALLEEVAEQIEQQTRPPKPAEPGKYGAVLAGDGREWIRYTMSHRQGRDWCRPGFPGGTEYARWDDLDVVRVLSEGVTNG